jgi:hypothetical protein
MKCKAVLREIEELEVGARPSVEVHAHLQVCASCRAFAHERAALRQLVGSLERVSAPPDFDWRLRGRLAAARSEREQSGSWRFSFTPGAQAITLAASFALLVVTLVVYRQTTPLPANGMQSGGIAARAIAEGAGAKPADTPSRSVKSENPGKGGKPNGSLESSAKERPHPRPAKNMKASGAINESTIMASGAQPQRIFSNDFGSRGAEALTAAGPQGSSMDTPPGISVRVPSSNSAQLRFEDGQGTKRTLSPINFGGQELVARPEKARLVSASEKGIW